MTPTHFRSRDTESRAGDWPQPSPDEEMEREPAIGRSILFVDHAPALGGAERSLLLVLKHLDRTRWQPHLACSGGPLAEHAVALGIPVYRVPLAPLRRSPLAPLQWLAGARTIARLVDETGANLLVANTVRAAVYAAGGGRLARVPWVWHMRDFWLSETRPRRQWADQLGKRLLCSAAAQVLANSHATARHLPCGGKVTVVHNGIGIERFDPQLNGGPFRRENGIPPQVPVVGVVGRLRPWKGQARFLRTMATVARAMPGARFLVVGGALFVDDGYRQELLRLAAELDLSDRVLFAGQLDDVRPALAAMDVFVHPGDPEPFGLVTIEAMAMQKPVVAFAHGGLPEIVAAGETGLLVQPGDESALAQAVLVLLGDPARRAAMGRMGRARVKQCFTAQRMAGEVSTALGRIVSSR